MESTTHELLAAAKSGNIDQLRQIDPSLLSGTTPQQNTVLHLSVMYGHEEFVKEMCTRDASMLLKANSRGETPLHLAAALGHDSLVTFFIKISKDADIEHGGHAQLHQLLTATNWKGDTALHEAVRNGRTRAAMELLHADTGTLKLVNADGESVLYLAAVRPLPEVICALRQKSLVGDCRYEGPRGRSALHAAVLVDHPNTVKELLSTWPALAKERDDAGSTPLHYAAEFNESTTWDLLAADPSMAYVLNEEGASPLHVSAKTGNLETFQAIVEQCPDTVSIPDRHGRNVLHIAINEQKLEMVTHILSDRRLAVLMNQRDNVGNTPLHSAAEQRDESFLFELLKHEIVNIKALNNNGEMAMDIFFKGALWTFTLTWLASSVVLYWVFPRSSYKIFHRDETRQKFEDYKSSTKKEYVEMLLIVATLVATVTFAAPFAMPGGYNSSDSSPAGLAVLAKKAALQVFLLCDTVAMLFSVFAVVFGMLTVRKVARMMSIWLEVGYAILGWSFMFLSLAFGTGVYAVIAPSCLWLAILICLMCCSIPIFEVARLVRWCCTMVVRIRSVLKHIGTNGTM